MENKKENYFNTVEEEKEEEEEENKTKWNTYFVVIINWLCFFPFFSFAFVGGFRGLVCYQVFVGLLLCNFTGQIPEVNAIEIQSKIFFNLMAAQGKFIFN